MDVPLPSLAEYWDLCDKHNWFFDNDGNQNWNHDNNEERRLLRFSHRGGPLYQAIFSGMKAHYMSSATDRPAKPERP